MKWLLVLLALVLALFGGWLLVAETGDGAALRPEVALVPNDDPRSPDALPAVSSAAQARTRAKHEDAGAGVTEATTQEIAPASGNGSQEFVFFRARLHDSQGADLADGTLSLPFLPAGGSTSEFQDGWLTLKLLRSKLTGAALQFRADAPGHSSVLFQRSWNGSEMQHVGEFELQPGSRVSGRVFDATGRPAANALVRGVKVSRDLDEGSRRQRELQGPGIGKYGTGSSFLRADAAVLSPETRADASGYFTLEAIPRAWVQVWARSADSRWTWSDQIAIHPDRPVLGLELQLPAVAPTDWIRGVVLDPDGAPVAFQEVRASESDRHRHSTCTTDARGQFEFAVADGGSRDLVAKTEVWEWEDAHAPAVEAGSDGIVLQFTESEWLWVHVTDGDGQPVTRGRVEGIRANRSAEIRLSRIVSDLWDDGRARLHAPQEDFDLLIHADGFESARLGPYSWGVTERIDVVLDELRGLRVTVTFDGEPVPGAQIRLRSLAPEGKEYAPRWMGEGTPLAQDLMPTRSGYSLANSSGEALLSITGKSTIRWRLIASGDGRASGYSAIVTTLDAQEQRHVEIRLPRHGSLRGVLLLPEEVPPEGWTVAVCDGLGITHETTVRSSGDYNFERLHPGPWQVRALRPGEKISDNRQLHERQTRETDVEIVAGMEATHDFTPPARVVALLRGQLSIAGHELGPWRGSVDGDAFEFDEQGTFEIGNLTPGEHRLHFGSTDPRWSHLQLMDWIQLLEGDNWWEEELVLGKVALTFGTQQDGVESAEPTRYRIQTQDEDLQVSILKKASPGAEPEELLLPAGKYLVNFRIVSFAGPSGPLRPELPFEVRAGETVELELELTPK